MAWRRQYGALSNTLQPAPAMASRRNAHIGMVTRVPARLEGGTNPGELEVLVGLPQWMPGGASTVYVTAECDDGAAAASDRLHSNDNLRSLAPGGWRDGLGGAFVLPVRDARSVTLHVMVEDAARPWLAARSLGGTTIMLPEPDWAAARTRMDLVAPLDTTIELAFTPQGAYEAGYYKYDAAPARYYETAPVSVGSWRVVS